EAPHAGRQTLVEKNQADQQNKTANGEIDRDFPGRAGAVAGSPNSDEQKRRNQRQLVEGVKEKQIDRTESADRAGRNKEETGVKRIFVVVDLPGEPDRGDGHDGGEQKHEQAQAVHAEGEMDSPIG